MTLFKVGDGRMAIHTMNAKQIWYNDLIQGRGRPNGHPYHECEAYMVQYLQGAESGANEHGG